MFIDTQFSKVLGFMSFTTVLGLGSHDITLLLPATRPLFSTTSVGMPEVMFVQVIRPHNPQIELTYTFYT